MVECNVLVISLDQLSAAAAAAACAAAAPRSSVARCMSHSNDFHFAAVVALPWLPP